MKIFFIKSKTYLSQLRYKPFFNSFFTSIRPITSTFRNFANLIRSRIRGHFSKRFSTAVFKGFCVHAKYPYHRPASNFEALVVTISIPVHATIPSFHSPLPMSSSLSFSSFPLPSSFAQCCGRRGRTRRYCRRLIASALLPLSLSSWPPTVHHDVTAIQ